MLDGPSGVEGRSVTLGKRRRTTKQKQKVFRVGNDDSQIYTRDVLSQVHASKSKRQKETLHKRVNY